MTEIKQRTLFDAIDDAALPEALLTPDEIFDRLDQSLLQRLSEDRRIERKPAAFSGSAIAEYLSMWSNTAPDGGILVIGILDDGTFEGLDDKGSAWLNKLEKCGHTHCPDAPIETRRVAVTKSNEKKDFVLAFRVRYQKNRVVKTKKGAAFVRRGDSKYKLSAAEIRELQADKNEVSFESEPSALAYPADFDKASISAFAATVREARDLDNDHTDEDVLTLMRLGEIDGGAFTPNIACTLLFATDPRRQIPGCRVRFLRFEGGEEGTGEKWNAVKDEFVEGPVPEVIVNTSALIESQVRTFSRLDPNERFTPQPEYPKTAWYEAVVNACVHRSYGNGLKNASVFVKMFDDRLVVESPGPLPPFVTPENIYESHHPRNPYLMDALFYLDFVRCAHEGTRRMRASMSEMALPDPEFEEKETENWLVRVTLRNNVNQRKAWVDGDVTDLIGAVVARNLTENEKRCLNFVAEHGEVGVSDAQRLTHLSWPAAKKILVGLTEKGILRHDKRDGVDRDPQARFRLDRDDS